MYELPQSLCSIRHFTVATEAGNFLPIKNDACMNVCHACTVGYICNSHLVYCHGKVHKVMNIKDVFLKCKNIRLH